VDDSRSCSRASVVLADDHLVTRAGLRAVLADDPDFEVVGEANSGARAVAMSRSLRPDLVLMDVRMPDMDGVQATRLLKETLPNTTILILSMLEDPELLLEALKAGAAGYVLKSASESDLRVAMRDALAGNLPVDRHLVRDVLWRLATESPEPSPPIAATNLLSGREREVLELLARGCTNREIAEQLVISASTVKVHVEHILDKLDVSDRTQAAVQAIQLGYVVRESHAPVASVIA
jgi:DNA-binding NarL/FixJ family response regulator